MKFCALLFLVAAVCVLLPSDAESSAPHVRSLVRRARLESAKRPVVKRDDDDDDVADWLASDEVAELLARHDITMEDLDDAIENDDEIEPEDRDAIKALAILVLAAIDMDVSLGSLEDWSSSEED